MPSSLITAKGQTTIPKAIRHARGHSQARGGPMIGLDNEAAGCEYTLTFDRALKRISHFKVI